VAASLPDRFPDGVFLVELAGLADGSLVAREILSVLELSEVRGGAPVDTLAEHLVGRATLLVLDNCEHLVAACASLADRVLRKTGAARILATSREPLGVPGEMTWPVPPLDRVDATRLFADRVAVAAPGLDLERSGEAVELICSRLEGIPLAIELAAARTKVLSPAEIADRLDDHLRLLVGGPRVGPSRHRTLRAAVDWSYEGLSAAEQRLFARLSVFAGGFRLDGAEALSGDPDGDGDVLDVLDALVDKSLVVVDRSRGGLRYRVLETLRQYGAERLAAGGDASEARTRHLGWAVALAELGEGDDAEGQADRLALLDQEHDNLRAALDWAAADGSRTEEGLRLAAGMARFWEIRGHLAEGRARLQFFAARAGGPPALRARALNAAAVLAQRQGDLAGARAAYQEALVIQRARGDRLGVATGLHGLANLAVNDGDLVTASALFEENLVIAREIGNRRIQAASLMNLGVVAHAAFMRGLRPVDEAGPDARGFYRESLVAYEDLGDRYGQALALENLGALTRLYPGDVEAARTLHEQSLALRRELGDRVGIADSARYIAALAVRTGEVATARQLHEERLAIERDLGNAAHVGEALTDLGEIALVQGRLADATAALEEAQSIYQAANEPESLLRVLTDVGELARREGDYGRARATLDRCLRLASDVDSRYSAAWVQAQLARLALVEGDPGAALASARDALDIAEEYQLSGVEVVVVEVAGAVAAAQGDIGAAVRLAAAGEALRRSLFRPIEVEPPLDAAAAVAALGRAAYEAARAEGASMPAETRRALVRGVRVA
jgi:predicted ATPase